MDIQVVSKNCAKIILTKNEAQRLKIDFENFNKENPQTKALLSYIIAILKEKQMIKSQDDKIVVEIYEQENADLIIYVSSANDESSSKYKEFVFISDSPKNLIDFVKTTTLFLPQNLKEKGLYFYHNTYYLFFSTKDAENFIDSVFYDGNIFSANDVFIQKAKEYGKFLTHTPFKIIKNLSSD